MHVCFHFFSAIGVFFVEVLVIWFSLAGFLTGGPAGRGVRSNGLRRDRGVPPPVDPPVGLDFWLFCLAVVWGCLLSIWVFLFLRVLANCFCQNGAPVKVNQSWAESDRTHQMMHQAHRRHRGRRRSRQAELIQPGLLP